MKKFICLFMIILTLFSFSTVAFAENSAAIQANPSASIPNSNSNILEGLSRPSTTANTNVPTVPIEDITEVTTEKTTAVTVTNPDINNQITNPNADNNGTTTTTVFENESLKPEIQKGKGYIIFVAENTTIAHTVTIKHKESKEKYELVFNADNLFAVDGYYPAGEYEIVSTEIESSNKKVKKSIIKETEGKKFIVKDSEEHIFTIQVKVKNQSYFIGFIKRQWWLVLILVGLYVSYKKLQGQRILPSKER